MTSRSDGVRVKSGTTDYGSLLESEHLNGRLIQPKPSACTLGVQGIERREKECTLDGVLKLTRCLRGLAILAVVLSIVYSDNGDKDATSRPRIRL